ncbi:MAG: hypothetical protein ACK5XN_26545, partial [Bacteroidota bacterium]
MSDLLVSIKGAKQNELILQYFQMQASEKKPIAVASLLKRSQATTSTLRSLIEKEVFEEYYLEQNRINFNGRQSDENLE